MLRPFSSIGSSITPAGNHTNGIAHNLHHHIQRRLDYGLNDIEADLNGSALFDENSSLAGTGDGKYSLAFVAFVPVASERGRTHLLILYWPSLFTSTRADDSKDSQHIKEELPKEWFYDDYTNEIDGLEDPKSPVDDEYDYDPRYGNKKRRRRRQTVPKLQKTAHHQPAGEVARKPRQSSANNTSRRGRRRATGSGKASSTR